MQRSSTNKSYFKNIQSIYNGCTEPLMICWFWLCYFYIATIFSVVLLHEMVCSYHNIINVNMHYITFYTQYLFIHFLFFVCLCCFVWLCMRFKVSQLHQHYRMACHYKNRAMFVIGRSFGFFQCFTFA